MCFNASEDIIDLSAITGASISAGAEGSDVKLTVNLFPVLVFGSV